jgi:hypothetical protein
MPHVEIAGPPDEVRRVTGEVNHVLAGSAADLDHLSRSISEMSRQHRPERSVVAMECRRIQPAVGLDPTAVPAEFGRIFSQLKLPENENDMKTEEAAGASE